MGNRPVYVAICIDVEEEGLFRGVYHRTPRGINNIPWLKGLDPILAKGAKPTLFCAHSVFTARSAWPVLENLRDHHGAEIGAHLHYWNTPPLPPNAQDLTRVPAFALERPVFEAKLENLFKAGREFQSGKIASFRMGRWDLHNWHWPYLFAAGIEVDSSIRPLFGAVSPENGADHFSAPGNPYWVENGEKRILEVPLTVVPISRLITRLHKILRGQSGKKARHFMQSWNVLSLLPAYHPFPFLKWATRIALSDRDILVITWHSSELMPGGAPHSPDIDKVRKMISRIGAWIDWLQRHWQVRFVTMSELRKDLTNYPVLPKTEIPRDWGI